MPFSTIYKCNVYAGKVYRYIHRYKCWMVESS